MQKYRLIRRENQQAYFDFRTEIYRPRKERNLRVNGVQSNPQACAVSLGEGTDVACVYTYLGPGSDLTHVHNHRSEREAKRNAVPYIYQQECR